MQYMYLIKCQQYHKIGVASDVESRLAQLSTGNPFPLEVKIVYRFDNAEIVERAVHQKFKDKRVRGEWFELEYQDTVDLHKLCLMLGGSAFEYTGNQPDEDAIEEAEELASPAEGGKWDYTAMFADGWCIEYANSRGKKDYWQWRKRNNGEKGYLYGGRLVDLPYPDLETMRRVYRDGLPVVMAESESE